MKRNDKFASSRFEMSATNRPRDLVSLSTTLKSFLSKEHNMDHVFALRLWQMWSQIAKKDIFKDTRPVSFEKGRLLLWVSSASEMQEIHFHIEELKQKIQEHFKTNRVESIHFTFNRDILSRREQTVRASELLF